MWAFIEKSIEWTKDNRVVVLLCLVVVINIFAMGIVLSFPIAKTATFTEPILKLSQIDGPRISNVAASIVAKKSALCRDLLSSATWVFLLIAYIALLVFNLTFTFKKALKVQWLWETILTLAFFLCGFSGIHAVRISGSHFLSFK